MSLDFSGAPPLPGPVFFDRRELMQILSVYGRLVAAAEARDYALADGRETLCRRHAFRWDRRRNKIISSQAALLMLKRRLDGEREDG